jgi:predicted AlkP superfamily pyrophosphatase or phosphodiesterase
MRNSFLLFMLFLYLTTQAQQHPKLVVGIVVDQMKMEYLYRFSDDFSPNGFKRLMKDGFTFHNMHYNYMPTYTGPGHASIYTGTTPMTHGIVANEWFNKALGTEIYCTDDTSVKTIGDGTKSEGEMSPKNMQTSTITDEFRLATNFNGKVIGMSLKDRGAILPAGHFANWAFWLSKSGGFISSSFYGEKLPDWVHQFNQEKRYLPYFNNGWSLFKPATTYNESLSDDNPYEGKLNGIQSVFSYDFKKIYEKNQTDFIRETPFGNDFLAEFALRAIQSEGLGKGEVTDFLTVSFSSTDYVGHTFGTRSMELQDTYLRLDQTIADFLNSLDETVGKGNYLIFLTADHGGAENAIHLKDNKYNVKNIQPKDIRKVLKQHSIATFGEDLVLNYSNFNLYFNMEIIKSKGLELTKVKQSFKEYLSTQEQVKAVYTEEDILGATGNDYFLNCIAKGYDSKQNGDLVVLDKPGFIQYGATGTSHGTPYSYDTQVPLLFYGWNIKKGEEFGKKVITQIAPTLSLLLKIPFSNGTEAEVLEEVLR